MQFSSRIERKQVFEEVAKWLNDQGLGISKIDDSRPWGGFFVIDEKDAEKFIAAFFQGLTFDELNISGKLSPKILVVEPGKRLSWQYHHRRAEIWKVLGGNVKVVTSETDQEKYDRDFEKDEIVELKNGERHRLIGLTDWGIVAEIWRHTSAEHPSDESDIVRVQDDFGR